MSELATQIRAKLSNEDAPLVLAHDEADFMREVVKQAFPMEDGEENK